MQSCKLLFVRYVQDRNRGIYSVVPRTWIFHEICKIPIPGPGISTNSVHVPHNAGGPSTSSLKYLGAGAGVHTRTPSFCKLWKTFHSARTCVSCVPLPNTDPAYP